MQKRKSKPLKEEAQENAHSRRAGILLPITSLASPFGIGDLGPEAKKFIDFLSRSKQSFWQILPLNPVSAEQAYSPYSSISSFAGNTLMISPELLEKDGLLSKLDVKKNIVSPTGKVDYSGAKHIREVLLPTAHSNFKKKRSQSSFNSFCQHESYWLDDFSLYVTLKSEHDGKPWYDWPEKYRTRNKRSIEVFSEDFYETLQYVKWQQFVFHKQWNMLKRYANSLGVSTFGDLPFYVSYDSADVWSHQEIFSISKNGGMEKVAGVPPDYFNKDGQLWGMPVFNWHVLGKRKYDWWLHRIRKNIELFDVLRLDHFRAFSSYWEVAGNAKTAIHGKWKPGPGKKFFQTLQENLGALPFVAEDLGDINDAVHALRKDFKLPGMKVLQFAFGDSMPQSEYIPHNYSDDFVVYTGTHDNNTTRGWFRQNATKKEQKHISQYLAKEVNEKNVYYELSRLAYASIAKIVILPIQDILGLDEKARINTPATTENNWSWSLQPGALTRQTENLLTGWSWLYNRR